MAFGKKPSTIRPLFFLILASITCMGSVVFIADEMCHRNITRRQPLYPDATVVERDYNFLRAQGLGITRMILQTDDDPETVREWMRQVTLDLLQSDDFGGIATVNWVYEANETGPGTQIFLYSECAQ